MSPLTKVSALALAVSFALALVAVPLVRWLARRLGLLDRPGGRREHAAPTVRLGGVAIVAAFALPVIAWAILPASPYFLLLWTKAPDLCARRRGF